MKQWFLERFLPMWAKETVLAENRQLRERLGRLEQKNRELAAYIRGLEVGTRRVKNAKCGTDCHASVRTGSQ